MVPCGVPAAIKSIPAGISQLSDPSLRYSRNSHTHTRGKPHLQHLFIFSRSAGVLSEKSAEGSCTLLTFTRIFIRNCSRDVTLRCYFQYQHICIHTRLTALFSGTTQVSRYRKVIPIWILLKQETLSGSGISWAIRKSATRSTQITTPAPHHSVFTGRMTFLTPSQQCQSTEGSSYYYSSTSIVK